MKNYQVWFLLMLLVLLWVTAGSSVAAERAARGAQKNHAVQPEQGRPGVIHRIDYDNNRIVIDDHQYIFFPQRLVVRKNGHVSSLKALRPDQRVRYVSRTHRDLINEIWID